MKVEVNFCRGKIFEGDIVHEFHFFESDDESVVILREIENFKKLLWIKNSAPELLRKPWTK